MLVLSRKAGEKIRIGAEIDLVVLELSHRRVKLGFVAPKEIAMYRSEAAPEATPRTNDTRTMDVP